MSESFHPNAALRGTIAQSPVRPLKLGLITTTAAFVHFCAFRATEIAHDDVAGRWMKRKGHNESLWVGDGTFTILGESRNSRRGRVAEKRSRQSRLALSF